MLIRRYLLEPSLFQNGLNLTNLKCPNLSNISCTYFYSEFPFKKLLAFWKKQSFNWHLLTKSHKTMKFNASISSVELMRIIYLPSQIWQAAKNDDDHTKIRFVLMSSLYDEKWSWVHCPKKPYITWVAWKITIDVELHHIHNGPYQQILSKKDQIILLVVWGILADL